MKGEGAHTVSIIAPCYNEQEVLPYFFTAIENVIDKMISQYDLDFECVFIDDGSSDDTLDLIKNYKSSHSEREVRYVSFSRNFGKEAALLAGLENAAGDYVVFMDVDLQDPPELIEQMYNDLVNSDYDCVGTRRKTRKGESVIRSFFARSFYKLINRISRTHIVEGARDYQMMSRQMTNAVLELREKNRFSKGLLRWVGFKTKWIEYDNVERAAGKTSWSFWGLLVYAIDGIIAFSTIPLVFVAIIGILFCIVALIIALIFIIKTLVFGDPVAGFPTLICIILFLGGVQLLCMGVIGQYLAKTYLEVKGRPIYIVKEKS
jgi:glycosyltransferase involved in cell wall biosynthesis